MEKITFKQFALFVCLLCAIMIFAIFSASAQGYIEGGINSLGLSINGGAKLNNVDIGGGADCNEFSKSAFPAVFHINVGYDINVNDILVTPSVGISYIKVTEISKEDAPERRYIKPYFSIKVGKDIKCGPTDERLIRPYLFASYSYQLYGGIGLRIYFK